MKALGVKVLPHLSKLYQYGVISKDERDEFARTVGLAMNAEDFYTAVTCKLQNKLSQTTNDRDSKALQECLSVLTATCG